MTAFAYPTATWIYYSNGPMHLPCLTALVAHAPFKAHLTLYHITPLSTVVGLGGAFLFPVFPSLPQYRIPYPLLRLYALRIYPYSYTLTYITHTHIRTLHIHTTYTY